MTDGVGSETYPYDPNLPLVTGDQRSFSKCNLKRRAAGQETRGGLVLTTRAAGARRDRVAMGAGARMAEKRADLLVEFRADDMLKLAGL